MAPPIRVPPDQSGTDRDTAANASSGRRAPSCLVILVSWVENRNASTRRCRDVSAWAKCSSMREYRSIEPLTSHSNTRGRGRTRRFRVGSVSMSPPLRRLSAIARRRSTRAPRPRIHRRVRRIPGFHTRRDSASRASTISSGVSAPKSLSAIPPRSLQTFTPLSGAGASPSDSPAAADGSSRVIMISIAPGEVRGSPEAASIRRSGGSCSRQNASNTRSNMPSCSRRWTSSARQA